MSDVIYGFLSLLYIVFCLVIWIFPIIICNNQAKKKNRSTGNWILLAVLFGWFAVLAILVVETSVTDEEKELDLEIKKAQLKKLKGGKK